MVADIWNPGAATARWKVGRKEIPNIHRTASAVHKGKKQQILSPTRWMVELTHENILWFPQKCYDFCPSILPHTNTHTQTHPLHMYIAKKIRFFEMIP